MSTPLVEMKDIRIAFGGVQAVDGVSIDLHPGEVVGLLGHNGAGKSTLIKILSGAYKMDSGEIRINGATATQSPATAIAGGIGIAITQLLKEGPPAFRNRIRVLGIFGLHLFDPDRAATI